MGCCCLSDSTVSSRSRSISNERNTNAVANDPNKTNFGFQINIDRNTLVHPNENSHSAINFETIPYYSEFSKAFEDFIGKVNRNYKQNRSRLIDYSNKWGGLLTRIQKALANPSENKIKELFNYRHLRVMKANYFKENSHKPQDFPHSSNSIIEERKEEDIEFDLKEEESQESSSQKNQASTLGSSKNAKNSDFFSVNKEKLIVCIQKAKLFDSMTNALLPYVQITVKEDIKEQNKEKITIFETKKSDKKGVPEWNEYFCKEFDKKIDLKKAVFTVKLLYFDSKSQQLSSLGENTFIFDEIKDQLINQKVIKYPKIDKIIAELFIKCQLIYDYKAYLKYWEAEVKVKKEIADRLLIKTHMNQNQNNVHNSCIVVVQNNEDEKNQNSNNSDNFRSLSEENQQFIEVHPNTFENKKSKESEFKENSILSMDEQSLAQSGYFDNQYYVNP